MSKQANKRIRRALSLPVNRDPLPAFAWPGGYPLWYLCADGGALCPDCVNKEMDIIAPETLANAKNWPDKQWRLIGCNVNWEDDALTCDHCYKRIESAYGENE